jgi:hypothetical protein
VSWFREWINREKHPSNGTMGDKQQPREPTGEEREYTGHIREAERRQLRRLLKRHDDLSYDLQRAHHALEPENRWTERIDQLNAAIEQAQADRAALEPERELLRDRPQLNPEPIQIRKLRESEPAEVTLRVSDAELTYREEIDWAERGHQIALPELRRVDGDVDSLIPSVDDPEIEQELGEHLRHSLATLANQALESAAAGDEPPRLTLADLTRRCPECGGWLDQKGRCPACTEINWKRQQVDSDLRRIRKEHDSVIQDLERYRDRLPVIQRQLTETEADIEKLRAKGVEPAD